MPLKLSEIQKSTNVAELLDKRELEEIGAQVVQGYEIDDASRAEWQELVDKAMDIAKQTLETKNHPYPNSSNVKYPLITQAAVDFAARMYPEIVQNDRVVKVSVIGNDPNNEKFQRASRVGRFLSYQLLHETPEWEDSLDKMLHILPILGTVFKKTYYNPLTRKPVSELCKPDKIVVNYNVQSLDEARRITHMITFHSNDIIERIRRSIYRDVDVSLMKAAEGFEEDDVDAPLELLEQHCYLDLDDDGYKEPYVVTVHKSTGKVLRVVQRFKKVEKNNKDEVIRIEPEQYFTDFHFIRSPDGGFYSVGLGTLLYPLNAAINTLINQLIDAGTINNMQSGFLGRGLRLKNGEFRFRLGEWKVLDAAMGTNLSQNIVPLPTKEPSPTLFQLLGLLIDVGKDLIAANDVMQGKGQTQNVPATTVMTLVEQGMKVYNAINKRLYRSLTKEFKKIYRINSQFLSDKHYRNILDEQLADKKADFKLDNIDILPISDPSMASDAQRLAKAQAIMQVPGLDNYEQTKYYLEALQLNRNTIETLLPPVNKDAPPPPEAQKVMAEIQKLQSEAQAIIMQAQVDSEKNMIEAERLKLEQERVGFQGSEAAARVMKMKQDALNNAAKVELAGAKADQEAQLSELDFLHRREKDEADIALRGLDVRNKREKDEAEIAVKGADVIQKHQKESKDVGEDKD